MGLFAQLQFTDGGWAEQVGVGAAGLEPDPGALCIEIHDSDIAGVRWPTDRGLGLLFLGHQPRDYFEDDGASPELDVRAEAAGLAAWAHRTTGVYVEQTDIEGLAAADRHSPPPDDFVEETVVRLLTLLGIPVPPALAP